MRTPSISISYEVYEVWVHSIVQYVVVYISFYKLKCNGFS